MQTIDIVPTIADLIGVDIPWEVDGLAAGSEAQRDRDDTKLLRQFPNRADPDPVPSTEVDGAAGFAEMLDLAYPPLDPDDPLRRAPWPVRPRRADRADRSSPPARSPATPSRSTTSTGCSARSSCRSCSPAPSTGGRVDEDAVAAVADGRIVAVSPVVHRNIGGPAFAMLLPLDGSAGLGELRLALVRGSELLDGGRSSTDRGLPFAPFGGGRRVGP